MDSHVFASQSDAVPGSPTPVLTVDNLTFRYPQATVDTLHRINLRVPEGAFVLLCGKTACGKTTLLRHLKPELAPHGTLSGSVSTRPQTTSGFVAQDPDNQIVTDLVFHELAFGLENQGLPTQVIRRRVAEAASFFGMEHLLEHRTHDLSGGQKQMLNLAAAVISAPDLLILDEPTDQLDPIAAKEFLQMLERANKELGVTLVVSEHRLDEILPLCDTAVFMEAGECVHSGTPQELVSYLAASHNPLTLALPEPTQAALRVGKVEGAHPLDVRTGRAWLTPLVAPSSRSSRGLLASLTLPALDESSDAAPDGHLDIARAEPVLRSVKDSFISAQAALTLTDLTFRYSKYEPFILKYLSTSIPVGGIHGIVGGNGSGKTTLFELIAGILKPQLGRVRVAPGLTLGALPQNPKAAFVCDTVLADLREHDERITEVQARAMAERMGLTELLNRHPYDLSGGEAQKAALAKLLLLDPDILLLDEPTKGLDALAKAELGALLDALPENGHTLVIVTHDLSFAARHTHTCTLLADGDLIASAPTHEFFNGNVFYTTAINRMTRKLLDGCLTVDDLVEQLTLQVARTPSQQQAALAAGARATFAQSTKAHPPSQQQAIQEVEHQ